MVANGESKRNQGRKFVLFIAPGLVIELLGIAYILWQIQHGTPTSAIIPAGMMIVIFGMMLTTVGVVAYSVKKRQAGGFK